MLEVDWNAGTCHLLYQADHNFSVFRGQTAPEEADRAFIERCVHPEDRARAAGLLGVLSGGFFREGTRENRSLATKTVSPGKKGFLWKIV